MNTITKTWNNHKLTIKENHFGENYCNGIKGYDQTRSIINWYVKHYNLNIAKLSSNGNEAKWSKLKTALNLKFSIL